MAEREIDWGGSNSPYRTTFDKNDDGRARLVEDTGGNVVLLEYDESAFGGSGGFVCRGPVEMSGNDVTGVGALDATSISAESVLTSEGTPGLSFPGSGFQTIDSTYDSIVYLKLFLENTAGTRADVSIDVAQDGFTTYTIELSPPPTGSAYGIHKNVQIPLEKGGAIQFNNNVDPNNGNSLDTQFYLSTR